MLTPSQKTRNLYEELGYLVGTVERYISPGGHGGYRKDLFGIIDYIAIKPGEIVGLQSTGEAFSEHHNKITGPGRKMAVAWLTAGGALHLVGWRKLGGSYEPRIKHYTLADFPPECPPVPNTEAKRKGKRFSDF